MVVQAMKQETFTDIEYSCRKKKTKREEIAVRLNGMDMYGTIRDISFISNIRISKNMFAEIYLLLLC